MQRIELENGEELITTTSFTIQDPKSSGNYAVNLEYLSFSNQKI